MESGRVMPGYFFTLPENGFTPPAGKQFYGWKKVKGATSYKVSYRKVGAKKVDYKDDYEDQVHDQETQGEGNVSGQSRCSQERNG